VKTAIFCSQCCGSHPLPCFIHPDDKGIEQQVAEPLCQINPEPVASFVFQRKVDVNVGYHLREISPRGIYGEISKVYEELNEYEEALEQGNRIMALLELSDVYGALEALVVGHGFTMTDIAKMSSATKRAFESGHRKSK
jgi:hypothetical protein